MTSRPIRFILFSISLVLIISSCNKINEATDVGDEIIPGVDGVNTFDTTIADLETYNTIFDPVKDSVRVERGDDHILGNIVSDPFFGKTNAKIFLELKPTFYPWNFSDIHNKDSLYLDSVVLVLGWSATYGDTMAPQRVRAWEMDQSNNFRIDSFYSLRDQYFTYSNLLGTKDFLPSQLKDSVKVFQDTTAGQLRIRLNDAFGRRLLDYDTTNAYKSDSAFKSYLKGFAIDADQSFGNALMAFGLADNPNTNLAIYYRYRKGGQDDTTVSYFQFTGFSARHNYIERFDFAGTPLQAASNTPAEDDLIYLINTPGSFATVKIPVLRNLSSRLINRAELIVEEVFDPSDKTFTPPEGLMLDVYDSTLDDYKFMPYDYAPDQTGLSNIGFGMYGKRTVDAFGNP
ncbi:MAG TPA: DUF4270 family protein, partial [Chitinophagaceae bacterium]|nr:DUF4270 family protein [Chitinophagaceae bacterium]